MGQIVKRINGLCGRVFKASRNIRGGKRRYFDKAKESPPHHRNGYYFTAGMAAVSACFCDRFSDHAVRDPGDPAGLADRNACLTHSKQSLVPQGGVQSLEIRHIAAPGEPGHDLDRPFIVHPRFFIFDVDAEIFLIRLRLSLRRGSLFPFLVGFVAVKVVEVVGTDEGPDVRCVDQIVGKISLKATVLVAPGMLADRGLDRILMNIFDDREKLVGVADRAALEAGLEETAYALVFFVVPVNKAWNDMLKDPAEGHLAGLDDQMDVVGHQAVREELKAADGLIFTKNRQKLAVIIVIGKDLLLVDTAINNVMNVEGAFFALRC